MTLTFRRNFRYKADGSKVRTYDEKISDCVVGSKLFRNALARVARSMVSPKQNENVCGKLPIRENLASRDRILPPARLTTGTPTQISGSLGLGVFWRENEWQHL